jgi:hypothetical protein
MIAIILIGFACAFAAMIVAATYMKWKEEQAAKLWLPAPGRIITSRAEAREVASPVSGVQSKGPTESRNFAVVVFQYKVGDRSYTGSRYSLRHDVGNAEVAATLARYPKGAAVTVYYDPAKPDQSVIERVMADGSFDMMVKLAIGLVVGVIALVVVGSAAMGFIRPSLPKPENLGAAVLTGLMALFVLRMAFMQRALAGQASEWPTTRGIVSTSGLQAFHVREAISDSWYRPWRKVYKSRIVYDYSVGGQDYAGDRVTFGATVISTLAAMVEGQSRSYPPGSEVDVHYDPANAASSVLECRVRGLWLLWAASAALIGTTGALLGIL